MTKLFIMLTVLSNAVSHLELDSPASCLVGPGRTDCVTVIVPLRTFCLLSSFHVYYFLLLIKNISKVETQAKATMPQMCRNES